MKDDSPGKKIRLGKNYSGSYKYSYATVKIQMFIIVKQEYSSTRMHDLHKARELGGCLWGTQVAGAIVLIYSSSFLL